MLNSLVNNKVISDFMLFISPWNHYSCVGLGKEIYFNVLFSIFSYK